VVDPGDYFRSVLEAVWRVGPFGHLSFDLLAAASISRDKVSWPPWTVWSTSFRWGSAAARLGDEPWGI
jgi:hypothetical protein